MIHWVVKIMYGMLLIAGVSCTRSIYPAYRAWIDPSSHRIVVSEKGLSFNYDSSIEESQFISSFAVDSLHYKLSLPSGYFRTIAHEIGLTRDDSILFVNPFLLVFITGNRKKIDYDNILDYAHCDDKGAPTICQAKYMGMMDAILPDWIVYQKIIANVRCRRIIYQHYIPYQGNYICMCFILQSINNKNRNIVPRIYSTNYDVTRTENMIFMYHYIKTYVDNTKVVMQCIHH